jgi:hypothetical protein
MKKVSEIITHIKDDIAAKLPGILAAYGVPGFEMYGAGYPTDQGKLFCAVRFNRADVASAPTFTFTVQLQLPGIGETEAYKYLDAVSQYLFGMETENYGYYTGNFTVEMLENFRVSDTEIFFDYTMTGVMDDCEQEEL